MAKVTKAEQADAIERLKRILRPGDTVWAVLRHRSASGMYRAIDLYVFRGSARNPDHMWLSYLAAKACGFRFDEKREAIGVGGCGMDMGFALVYDLGRTLFPKGGSLRHSGRHRTAKDGLPKKETDGGYLLQHRWIG